MSSIRKAVEIDLKKLVEDPYVRTSRRAEHYGTCDRCRLFGVIVNFNEGTDELCRDCYEEVFEKVWIKQRDEELAAKRAERIRLINAQELKKRRSKGLAVINLRK